MAGKTRALPTDMAFDAVGHALYARVTSLPDFGMARAEAELLRTCRREILDRSGRPREIVDLRAGNGDQARPLLGREIERYVAIERCRSTLNDAIEDAASCGVDVQGIAADATTGLGALPHASNPRLLLLLGGSLSRLEPTDARLELSRIRSAMTPEDRLLVGMDLVKEPYRLQAAYDDAGGVYAAFVRNALRRANREIGTDFRLGEWQPKVKVQKERGYVEVSLESRCAQSVSGGRAGDAWGFEAGESIVVERAQKPTEGQFAALALAASFRVVDSWRDVAQGFAAFLLASDCDRYLA